MTSEFITARDILVLSQKKDLDPKSILGDDVWDKIQKIVKEDIIIRQEKPRREYSNKNRQNVRSHPKSGSWKKPTIKPKPSSFDDAMKQKIVGDLNKISPTNYKDILKSISGICDRLSDDEYPWALRLILENATRQHIYATTYITLYKDVVASRSKQEEVAKDIIKEFLNLHKEKILTEIDNGDNYDEFCKANKMKTELIGHSIVIGEAVNSGMIPMGIVGPHATALVSMIQKIREVETSKETKENGIRCITEFFKIVSKTKSDKQGFKDCITGITKILDVEKKEKSLSPKARFGIMDFVDEMIKCIKEKEVSRKIYTPGMFSKHKKTLQSTPK